MLFEIYAIKIECVVKAHAGNYKLDRSQTHNGSNQRQQRIQNEVEGISVCLSAAFELLDHEYPIVIGASQMLAEKHMLF